jgi:hypothetical protein
MDVFAVLFILSAATNSAHPASEEIAAAVAEATEAANSYADCAGWWDFMSAIEGAAERPASAEQLRNVANGAQTAALWLHAQAYALTAKKPARYGTWLPLVAPRRAAASTRAAAMVEQGDVEFMRAEGKRCQAMLEGQQHAIDEIRKDSVQSELDSLTSEG